MHLRQHSRKDLGLVYSSVQSKQSVLLVKWFCQWVAVSLIRDTVVPGRPVWTFLRRFMREWARVWTKALTVSILQWWFWIRKISLRWELCTTGMYEGAWYTTPSQKKCSDSFTSELFMVIKICLIFSVVPYSNDNTNYIESFNQQSPSRNLFKEINWGSRNKENSKTCDRPHPGQEFSVLLPSYRIRTALIYNLIAISLLLQNSACVMPRQFLNKLHKVSEVVPVW